MTTTTTNTSALYNSLLAVETSATAAPDMRRILSQERQLLGLVVERAARLQHEHRAAVVRARRAERALDAVWRAARERYVGIMQQAAYVRDEHREYDAASEALRAAASALHEDAATIADIARTAESWGVEVQS